MEKERERILDPDLGVVIGEDGGWWAKLEGVRVGVEGRLLKFKPVRKDLRKHEYIPR